jgi:cytochrome c1
MPMSSAAKAPLLPCMRAAAARPGPTAGAATIRSGQRRRPALVELGLALAIALAMSACRYPEPSAPEAARSVQADRQMIARGEAAFRDHGCGACHRLSGVAGADGTTGPPLDDLATRVYIAGHLPNSEAQRQRFIERPHEVDPRTAMPSVGLSSEDARAIARFLMVAR